MPMPLKVEKPAIPFYILTLIVGKHRGKIFGEERQRVASLYLSKKVIFLQSSSSRTFQYLLIAICNLVIFSIDDLSSLAADLDHLSTFSPKDLACPEADKKEADHETSKHTIASGADSEMHY